ncbi:hypothetical protein B0H10DRAFT_1788018, partial [Mycena sp. CBHHK59/15]
CCITTCIADVKPGFRTCGDPEHCNIELYQYQKGKAMFQLKNRLQRTYRGEIELDAQDDECDGKPAQGNRTVRARFGHKRTHNEELCVYSCGTVAGRATFLCLNSLHARGIPLTIFQEFWMKLWPTKASLPTVLWHDNNCSIVKMLCNEPDEYKRTYFDHVALPVDIFHFKCKHKETDLDCGANCNLYLWADLHTEDGKWRFNSSTAEQTNTWFGGFQSMVQEMPVERYNFFLDEMIKRRNCALVKDLHRRQKAPHNIPQEFLLGDYSVPVDKLDLDEQDRAMLLSEGMVSIGEQLPGPHDYDYDDMPGLK